MILKKVAKQYIQWLAVCNQGVEPLLHQGSASAMTLTPMPENGYCNDVWYVSRDPERGRSHN